MRFLASFQNFQPGSESHEPICPIPAAVKRQVQARGFDGFTVAGLPVPEFHCYAGDDLHDLLNSYLILEEMISRKANGLHATCLRNHKSLIFGEISEQSVRVELSVGFSKRYGEFTENKAVVEVSIESYLEAWRGVVHQVLGVVR